MYYVKIGNRNNYLTSKKNNGNLLYKLWTPLTSSSCMLPTGLLLFTINNNSNVAKICNINFYCV